MIYYISYQIHYTWGQLYQTFLIDLVKVLKESLKSLLMLGSERIMLKKMKRKWKLKANQNFIYSRWRKNKRNSIEIIKMKFFLKKNEKILFPSKLVKNVSVVESY